MKWITTLTQVIFILILSVHSAAQTDYDFPESCSQGRDESVDGYVEVSNSDINSYYEYTENDDDTFTEESGEILSIAKSIWELFSGLASLNNLRIEGPKYVLKDSSNTFKGNSLNPYDYVYFYTSEDGYIGSDKTSIEANAYKNISFDERGGPRVIWVENDGLCSMMMTWVQDKKPTVDVLNFEPSGEIIFKYSIDKNSKAALDPDAEVKVWVEEQFYGGSQEVHHTPSYYKDGLTNTVTLDYNPEFRSNQWGVWINVSDGTYTTKTAAKFYGGNPVCPPSGPCFILN